MKNSLNLVLAILFFVVLGCSCPNMEELAKKIDNSSPSSSPASSPSTNNSTTKSSDAALTLEKYNKLKDGMSYKEVVDIMGSEGTEVMNSGSGKYKVTSYKWEGDNFQYLSVVFMGDKMTSKVQNGLK